MSTEGLLFSAVMFVLGIAWVLMPVLVRKSALRREQLAAQKARDELLTTYERVLAVIRDLDEDFATGKLTEDVYQRERELWSQRGVDILQILENAGHQPAARSEAAGPKSDADKILDDVIERAIADYRAAINTH